MMYTSIFVLLFLSIAQAVPVANHLLLRRQNTFPAVCSSVCEPLNTKLQLCTSFEGSCVCDALLTDNLAQSCLDCLVANQLTDQDIYLAILANLEPCEAVVSLSSAGSTATPTQLAGADFTVSMWQPSGYEQVDLWGVKATGGDATRLYLTKTFTVSDPTLTSTGTAEAQMIAAPTQNQYVVFDGESEDYLQCDLQDNVGECIRLQYSGTVVTASTDFTLTGSTVPILAKLSTPTATAK